MKTVGYAAHTDDAKLVPYHFERRDLRENDVAIEILYCGVCHSDLHTVNGDWGPQPYPLIRATKLWVSSRPWDRASKNIM